MQKYSINSILKFANSIKKEKYKNFIIVEGINAIIEAIKCNIEFNVKTK